MINHNISPVGVDPYTPDFITISKGFGAIPYTVNSLKDLESILVKSRKSPSPIVIVVNEEQLYQSENITESS